jgi:aryl-alcohol dehydrogenase-like predicted oxidoreductase
MRLDRAGDVRDATNLLDRARDIGISTFHCSSEYETFPLFREAWRAARLHETTVIAKVAAPHFGETEFSAPAFRKKVETYLAELDIERIDVVQWLLRFDLKQESGRRQIHERGRDAIGAVIDALQREGKIGAMVSFPYTDGLAALALREVWCDGLAVYVNPLEREMDERVAEAGERGKAVVAIRPFAAGRLFSETELGADDALGHVFGFDAVATSVVSASSTDHLDALCRWL